MKKEQGFTLIELTIFVILAGIILGLFFNFNNKQQISEIRSIVVQLERYNVAVYSFAEKYGELPGDISSTEVLGLSKNNTDGNENGVLEDYHGVVKGMTNSLNYASGEIVNFWNHLSNSGFLKMHFDGGVDDDAVIGFTFPVLSLNPTVGITVFGLDGSNYYQIGVSGANKEGIEMSDLSLRTSVAFGVDKKIDDGMATEGSIIAVGGRSLINGIENINKNCVTFNNYNLRYMGLSCQLRIKFSEKNEFR